MCAPIQRGRRCVAARYVLVKGLLLRHRGDRLLPENPLGPELVLGNLWPAQPPTGILLQQAIEQRDEIWVQAAPVFYVVVRDERDEL